MPRVDYINLTKENDSHVEKFVSMRVCLKLYNILLIIDSSGVEVAVRGDVVN